MSQIQLVDSASNPTTPADGRVNLGIKNNALAWVDDAGTLHSLDATGATLTLADGKVITFTGTGTVPITTSGTWTPTLKFGGASTGITYSARTGVYVRLGAATMFHCSIILTSKGSSTGQAIISGLPVSSTTLYWPNAFYFDGTVTTVAHALTVGSSLYLYAQAGSFMTDEHFVNTSTVFVSGVYA